MSYDPDTDGNVHAEAHAWGWTLHLSHEAMAVEQEIEKMFDKIVMKIVKMIPELEPARMPIKWTLVRHRKRAAKKDKETGDGVAFVSPWIWPTLLRPVKQTTSDTHLYWTAYDENTGSWSNDQRIDDDAFQSNLGPAIIGFENQLFSVWHDTTSHRLCYSIFGAIRDPNDPDVMQLPNSDLPVDWTPMQYIPNATTREEPALAVYANQLYCFFKGDADGDHVVFYSVWNGNGWGGPQQIPNFKSSSGLGAAEWNGKLYVMGPRSDQRLHWCTFQDNKWSDSYTLQSTTDTWWPPALTTLSNYSNECLFILQTATNQALSCGWMSGDKLVSTAIDGAWSKVGGSLISFGNKLYSVARGSEGDEKIWVTHSTDGVEWAPYAAVKTEDGSNPLTAARPGFTTFKHSTGTRKQLVIVHRGR